MNLKKFLIIVILVIIGGVIFITQKNNYIHYAQSEVKANIKESTSKLVYEEKALELVDYNRHYEEKDNTEWYEVTVKNTSGKYIAMVSFYVGDEQHELYDLNIDEIYKFKVYNHKENLNINIVSVEYDINKFNSKELSLKTKVDNNNISGIVDNTGNKELYPLRVVYYLTDKDGNTLENTIEYAGCFDEGLVINSNNSLEFNVDIPEEYSFNNDKKITIKYSKVGDYQNVKTIIF